MHFVAAHMAEHHLVCLPTASCEGAAVAAALELRPSALRAEADALVASSEKVALASTLIQGKLPGGASVDARADSNGTAHAGGGSFALDGDAFVDVADAFAASAKAALATVEATISEARAERELVATYLAEPEASLDGALEALGATLGAFATALDENERFGEAARAVSPTRRVRTRDRGRGGGGVEGGLRGVRRRGQREGAQRHA